MTMYWSTVNDDDLRMANQTVEFLQTEFCPPGAEPMWSVEYFRWKIGPANPAGKGYLSVATIDNRVVGTVSLTKKRILIDGNECIGGEVGDSYTSAAARRRGRPADISPVDPDTNSYVNKSIFGRLASDVRTRAEKDGISIIYGTPNSRAYPGWVERLGYFELKDYHNRSFSRPTPGLVALKYPSLTFMTTLLQGIDYSCIALQKFSYNWSSGRSFTFEFSAPLLDELDELWNRVKPIHGFSLVRDASYWRHRYLEHPLAKYTFITIREGYRLMGVLVARLLSVGGGRCVVSIVEWMNEKRVPFGNVLAVVLDYYRSSKVDVFNLWAKEESQEAKAAVRSLFLSRKRIPIIFADTPQARSLQAMAPSFKFYLGSSDAV